LDFPHNIFHKLISSTIQVNYKRSIVFLEKSERCKDGSFPEHRADPLALAKTTLRSVRLDITVKAIETTLKRPKLEIECPNITQTNKDKIVHPIMSFPPVEEPARTEGVSPYVRLNTLDILISTSHRSYHFFKNHHLDTILCNGRRNMAHDEPSSGSEHDARSFISFAQRSPDGWGSSILYQPTRPTA